MLYSLLCEKFLEQFFDQPVFIYLGFLRCLVSAVVSGTAFSLFFCLIYLLVFDYANNASEAIAHFLLKKQILNLHKKGVLYVSDGTAFTDYYFTDLKTLLRSTTYDVGTYYL